MKVASNITADESKNLCCSEYMRSVLTMSSPDDLILSVETNGLPDNPDFEIIHLTVSFFGAALNNGRSIVSSFIRPVLSSDVSSSTPYNGITNDMVRNAPVIGDKTRKKLEYLFKDKKVYVWNKEFTALALISAGIRVPNLVDVQEEARWDLSIANPNERPDLWKEPQFLPKCPTWQDVLGRKPSSPDEKITFIRFTQKAMEKGGITSILDLIRVKKEENAA